MAIDHNPTPRDEQISPAEHPILARVRLLDNLGVVPLFLLG
jgi:hypothetical protein